MKELQIRNWIVYKKMYDYYLKKKKLLKDETDLHIFLFIIYNDNNRNNENNHINFSHIFVKYKKNIVSKTNVSNAKKKQKISIIKMTMMISKTIIVILIIAIKT